MQKNESYQLYYFTSCPYCIKTRIQLSLLGIKIPLKNIHRDKASKKALIDGGGKEQVPCLRIERHQGEVQWLYESADIVNYFKQQNSKK